MREAGDVRERPIIFSSEMVRAILAGEKTETRRIVRPRPQKPIDVGASVASFIDLRPCKGGEKYVIVRCPYGAPGDRLWVRETWRPVGPLSECTGPDDIRFKASVCEAEGAAFPWHRSIFMPRWASRITLEVKNVRAERLQEITPPGVHAEGIGSLAEKVKAGLVGRWAAHWDKLNGKRASWASNPWVWVVSFERVTP